MADLRHLRVAVLCTDGVEQVELTSPLQALREAGATAEVIAPRAGEIQGFDHHDKAGRLRVDRALDEARPDLYDALVLPGGALNADALRVEPAARTFIREMVAHGKPVAAICHAPWALISAGVARDRRLTSWPTLEDDLRNAGAHWVDEEVVVDGLLVTSRKPSDLPAFNREMIALFSRSAQPAT